MKVSNFISVYNARLKRNNDIDVSIIINIISDLIKPVSYISYDNKIALCKKTIEMSKSFEFPTPERKRLFIVNLISAYTNLEINIKDFDLLSETKLLEYVLMTFDSEYKICNSIMEMCIYDAESR